MATKEDVATLCFHEIRVGTDAELAFGDRAAAVARLWIFGQPDDVEHNTFFRVYPDVAEDSFEPHVTFFGDNSLASTGSFKCGSMRR